MCVQAWRVQECGHRRRWTSKGGSWSLAGHPGTSGLWPLGGGSALRLLPVTQFWCCVPRALGAQTTGEASPDLQAEALGLCWVLVFPRVPHGSQERSQLGFPSPSVFPEAPGTDVCLHRGPGTDKSSVLDAVSVGRAQHRAQGNLRPHSVRPGR